MHKEIDRIDQLDDSVLFWKGFTVQRDQRAVDHIRQPQHTEVGGCGWRYSLLKIHTHQLTHTAYPVVSCLVAIRSVKLQKLNQRDIQDLNAIQVCITSFLALKKSSKQLMKHWTVSCVLILWMFSVSLTAPPWWWTTGLARMMCGVTSTMCFPQRVREVLLIFFVDKKTHLSIGAYWLFLISLGHYHGLNVA